jgi:hypothetical protein
MLTVRSLKYCNVGLAIILIAHGSMIADHTLIYSQAFFFIARIMPSVLTDSARLTTLLQALISGAFVYFRTNEMQMVSDFNGTEIDRKSLFLQVAVWICTSMLAWTIQLTDMAAATALVEVGLEKGVRERVLAANTDASITVQADKDDIFKVIDADRRAHHFFGHVEGQDARSLGNDSEDFTTFLRASLLATEGPAMLRTMSLKGRSGTIVMTRVYAVACIGKRVVLMLQFLSAEDNLIYSSDVNSNVQNSPEDNAMSFGEHLDYDAPTGISFLPSLPIGQARRQVSDADSKLNEHSTTHGEYILNEAEIDDVSVGRSTFNSTRHVSKDGQMNRQYSDQRSARFRDLLERACPQDRKMSL